MDFQRLFEILPYQKAKYPQKIALASKPGFRWKTYSTLDCLEIINKLSAGLLDLGLKKGEKVGILAHIGSPAWNFTDFALQQIGVVVVPIHATSNQSVLEFILNDAEIKYCFAATHKLYEKASLAKGNALGLKKIITFEKLPDVPHWEELLTLPTAEHFAALQTFKAAIHEDDLATIIYTSGTTGNPKGVMLSHKNIISNIKAIISLVPVNCNKRTISILPISHIFERMVTYVYMAAGASLYYVENPESLFENMREIRPHFFTAVPRLLEKIYDNILEEGNKKNAFRRKILHWTLAVGERFDGRRKLGFGYWLKLALANFLVYRHWRKAIGNRVEGIFVGAAALQPKLGRLFSAACIAVREGYGLTETAPAVAFNQFEPGLFRFGTVGIPVPGVEVKIEGANEKAEGEIFVKGPNVMLGYYKKPEETAKVLCADGWLKTGDVGKFVQKRFLQITDRKKNIFKTSSGKYVAPQIIENQLKSSNFIEQCLVIGFARSYVTALIVPSFPMLQNWCEENEVHWTAPQFMSINPKVEKMMSGIIEQCNRHLESHEKVRKFTLLHEEWTVEKGEVSPTMKVIRGVILERYQKEIDKMYK